MGDFHLWWNSALVDAGTNVVAPSEDFEGDSRPMDGNGDGFAVVDIGADEYLPGTQKLVFRLGDSATIEGVLIPDGARLTLCMSTQQGCGMGCAFCATATLGFRRHLARGEIVEQLLLARALLAAPSAFRSHRSSRRRCAAARPSP